MTSSNFPTRLAELSLNDASIHPSIYASIRSLRKSVLSIPHRLTSILADAAFAKQVSEHYSLPLVANERCGSWYIDPADKVGSAYFKSTDGHHGQWSFSLRRLNLQLLPLLARYGGAVVVDSTRRGKNLPDAFSKTVPIWVSVVNRTLFPELTVTHILQLPPAPNDLGQSEASQIESRLDAFAKALQDLQLDFVGLRNEVKHPIRLQWAINGSFDVDSPHAGGPDARFPKEAHRLVLCSASRRVHGAEISEGGYIQGAGDDSEGWSHGLTAQVFWRHRQRLMSSSEEELPDIIDELMKGVHESDEPKAEEGTWIPPTQNLYVCAGTLDNADTYDLVIDCNGGEGAVNSKVVGLACRSGKLGSKDLREKLPSVAELVRSRLVEDPNARIVVTCTTGKDLSVGVAVAVLCLYYDDSGQVRDSLSVANPRVDKLLVKQRLAWISAAMSWANPSRSTLQAVNSFLMQRPEGF
ncbi:hypothetical protein PV08_00951 [Exophiala spinifera]|uniref:Initiator tRNA phosphoribosyl transferase n=1 Tax=Exophiala spinifera TaxID=91928 RepID=A0A0D1YYL3_9EURO|nr:uncharacterized protein PV08_00951 [Exophiala spinifera]KIW20376.1 hypothetical protein PV08_00951 [Exophiala spinifera]